MMTTPKTDRFFFQKTVCFFIQHPKRKIHKP